MEKYQAGIILGIGIICAASLPLLFPRATTAVSLFPNPIILSLAIALAGLIVLIGAIIIMFKS